jgi:PAS domain S-box-containing protein
MRRLTNAGRTEVRERTRIHARLTEMLRSAPIMAWMAAADGSVTFVNRKWLTLTGGRYRDQLGDGWLRSVHRDDRARVTAEYRMALRSQAPFTIAYRMRRADGRNRPITQYALPLREDDGTFVGFVGTCVDATPDQDGAIALERPATHLGLVATLLNGLIANMNNGVLAEMDSGGVAVVNSAFYRLLDIPEPASGAVASLRPLVLERVATPPAGISRPRAVKGSRTQSSTELTLKDGRTLEQEYLAMRLDDGRLVHIWQFRDITLRKKEEEEVRTSRHRLRDLSAHLESAREEERREIARALHDEVGQLLTGIRLEIAAAVDRFRETRTPADFAVVDRLQAAVGLVDLSVATVQRIATALRPPLLDHMGLTSAIRWEAAVFERRTGIRCRVLSNPSRIDARGHATILYRILLEALANVARHADAGTVWIHVRERSGRLTMEVRDNGRGISDEAASNPNTLGLLGMRERALAVGGDVTVARHAAGGTRVLVRLPLQPTPDRPHAVDDA